MRRGNLKMFFLLWVLLAAVLCGFWYVNSINKSSVPENSTSEVSASVATPTPTVSPSPIPEPKEDLMGVWVPYMSLMADDFKSNFQDIVDSAKKVGANALFVHVRPFSDALYRSKYYPWSHIITGTQGQAPNFDPMEYMINTAHENGMEFHAWINPLRVKLSETPQTLAATNVYTQLKESNPYYFIETDSGVFLDPSYSYVRELISNGVEEIVDMYDVDGIHFDDYFYPSDMGNQDELAYTAYRDEAKNPLSLEDWRKANINALVSNVYRVIKEADENVVFGISPQANISNNDILGADVLEWCRVKGYIDYIAPQIYFSYENPSLGFTESLDTWGNVTKHDDLDMYIGLALYKLGSDSDEGTWPADKSIIENQITDSINAGANGVILFDDSNINEYW